MFVFTGNAFCNVFFARVCVCVCVCVCVFRELFPQCGFPEMRCAMPCSVAVVCFLFAFRVLWFVSNCLQLRLNGVCPGFVKKSPFGSVAQLLLVSSANFISSCVVFTAYFYRNPIHGFHHDDSPTRRSIWMDGKVVAMR